MPISLQTTIAGDSSSNSFAISSRDGRDELSSTLTVKDGARLLVVTATDGGPDGHRRSAKNVRVILKDPSGQDYSESFTTGINGERTLILPSPKPGAWSITVIAEGDASGEVNTGVFGKDWKDHLRRGASWFSCTTCKLLTKALVIAAVSHLSIAAATGVATAALLSVLTKKAPYLVEAIMAIVGSGEEANELLKFLMEYINDPIDKLLNRACRFLKLCKE